MAAKSKKIEQEKKVCLSALNPFVVENQTLPVEKEISGKDFISFGENNKYFNYLYNLYSDAPTLNSIINGCVDYITGDEILCNVVNFNSRVNNNDETIEDIVKKVAEDVMIYGGFALQIIRNRIGKVGEIYHIPFENLRSNKDNTVFYYSEDWNKSYGRVKTVIYPKFKVGDSNPTSILYYKSNCKRTYPLPLWNSATIPAEIEKKINQFHLNAISNGFMGSYLFNFNDGKPSDEQREEIEEGINEKFAGAENAGTILISFNQDAEHKTEIEKLDADDFADRYDALQKRVREQLFIAFRATPVLFGLVTENNGFSTNEYRDSYKLFEKTVVRPIQKDIIKVFDKIFEEEQSIEIKPFTITFEEGI